EPRPHLLHAAERPDGDAAVGFAAPGAAPVFEAKQLFRGLLDEGLDGVLVAQPVAAGDGVIGVFVAAVIRRADAGRPPPGGDGVAAHRVDLGDDRDAELRVGLGDGDGGTKARAAATHQHDVVRSNHRPGPGTEGEDLTRYGTVAWIDRQGSGRFFPRRAS